MLRATVALLVTSLLCVVFVSAGAHAGNGHSAMDHFAAGVQAFESGDYDDALAALQKALDMDPAKPEFNYYRALTLGRTGRYDEAVSLLKELVDRDPAGYQKARYDIAAIYSKRGMFDKAVETLEEARAADPESARVQLEMAYAYKNLKDYRTSLRYLGRAAELDPTLKQSVYYDSGVILLDMELFDDAEEMLSRGVELGPDTRTGVAAAEAIENVSIIRKARKPVYLLGSFSWAMDDNVTLDPVQSLGTRPGPVIHKRDDYQTLSVRGGYKLVNRKDLEVGAGYSLLCVGYNEFTEGNVFAHIPHTYVQYAMDPLFFRLEYNFSYFYAGGELSNSGPLHLSFGNKAQSRLRMHSIMPSVAILQPHNLRSDLIFNYHNKSFLDGGATPDSVLYGAGIIQSYRFPDIGIVPRLMYRFGYEDADVDTASYRTHEIGAGIFTPLPREWRGDLGVSWLKTSYEDFPAPGGRKDRAYIGIAGISRHITEDLQVQFSYIYTRNNSNVSVGGADPFKFKKNVFSVVFSSVF